MGIQIITGGVMSDDKRRNRLQRLVDEIDDDGVGLTPWEIEFVESMMDRLDFSARQADMIEQIHERRVQR